MPALPASTPFTDPEWQQVFPVVRQLAAGAGLTDIAAPQDSPGSHDARFSCDDGRTLVFGSREATLITATVACRLPGEADGATATPTAARP